MKREQLFNKTVGVLVDAYNNGTLEHQSCQACAVGNIISAAYNNDRAGFETGWYWLIGLLRDAEEAGNEDCLSLLEVRKRDIEKLEATTGYTLSELARIEEAFEGVQRTKEVMDEIQEAGNAAMGKELDGPEWLEYNRLRAEVYKRDSSGVLGLRAVYDVLCDIHEVDLLKVAKAEEVFADKFATVD